MSDAAELLDLLIADVVDYAILVLDREGHVASWNPGAQRLKGYTSEQIVGRHFSVFYTPEDNALDRPARELEIAAADGRLEDEGWRVREDSTRFWANVVITALRDPDGTLRGFGKITRDLTERRAAEERIRASFDRALIAMMSLDLDGRYSRVNDAFCALVGHSREELIGLSQGDITHPEEIAADARASRSLVSGEATSYTSEKRYLHAAGHAIWSVTNMTLIRDFDEQPLHFIAQVQDLTERRDHEHALQDMADRDPLTGLLNRRSFQRELDSHIARAARYGVTGAVLMLDLDNFKRVNDTHGHSAGDQLMVSIARGLRSRLRDSDVLARIGGDEFAVLLPVGDEDETRTVAEALLRLVRDEASSAQAGQPWQVSASIGIARFDEDDRQTGEEIMVNADLAMYDAKRAGRDRWTRYSSERHYPRIEGRVKWADRINDAIASDGFELLAQPVVPLAGAPPEQYELLLRLRDPPRDLILPGSFLYVAERLGLSRAIDRWVTARAIDMLAEQRGLGRVLRLAVDLAGDTVGDEQLLALIDRRLGETGAGPEQLILEVAETAAIANIARAGAFAERLATLGCGFAIDDFGASLGSLYYLKHLPFDYLKIDREFVRNLIASDTDRTFVAAVARIARDMGKRTIAECVGDAETSELLARLGVDYGQGFYLGRPAPLSEHLAAADAADLPARAPSRAGR